MNHSFRTWIALVACTLGLATVASAQAPKVSGDYYEDAVDIGFKLKEPKGWDFVPGSPSEQYMIGKYGPPNSQYISVGKGAVLFQNIWLLKFDRRERADDEITGPNGEKITLPRKADKDIVQWITKSGIDEGKNWHLVDEEKYPKPLKGPDVPAEYYIFEGLTTNGDRTADPQPINCYAAVFKVAEDVDVAIVGVGPNESKKWKPYEATFTKIAKSFKTVEVAKPASTTEASGPMSLRDRKRAELEKKVATTPGWKLYETPNYFVISSNDDREFMKELLDRLEAIRAIYEVDYPADKARMVKTKGRGGAEGETEEDPEDEDQRSVSAVNPLEASRTSVVRVCKDSQEYMAYGGPQGSAGYWYWVEEELVVYDDKASGGREDTWLVLNHEAFHQYIFYFYGNISPHSWYNEGTGDFYSGYKYEHKKFKLKEAAWRVRTIQQNIRDGKFVPLKEFVNWDKTQYYGTNDLGLSGGDNYAQGWSLIYFLRTGAGKAKGWDDSWGGILDTYLSTLADTGDLKQAVATAFATVDWDAFEKSWKSYIE